ncbi:MAG: hypothetical protein AAF438_20755 [Pseudomonadota bacterium]
MFESWSGRQFFRLNVDMEITSVAKLFSYTCLAFFSLLANAQESVAEKVEFPIVGLEVVEPDGFERASSFHGFQQESTGSSVLLTSMPGPFSEVSKAFTKDLLAAQGIVLNSKDDVEVAGGSGLLLNVSQEAYEILFQKWVFAFGDEALSYIVTATFPQAIADEASDHLRDVVLTANPIAVSTEDEELPFKLTPAEGLVESKLPGSLGKAAYFTMDGKVPTESPDDPIFVAAHSLGQVSIDDRRTFAAQRLGGMAGITELKAESVKDVQVDGLPGVELIATGVGPKTGTPLFVYQLMLFQGSSGYVLMVGIARESQRTPYLEAFRDTASSYESVP